MSPSSASTASEAVELAIYKEGDANTVSVAGRSECSAMERLKAEQLPAERAELTTVEDQSIFIARTRCGTSSSTP